MEKQSKLRRILAAGAIGALALALAATGVGAGASEAHATTLGIQTSRLTAATRSFTTSGFPRIQGTMRLGQEV